MADQRPTDSDVITKARETPPETHVIQTFEQLLKQSTPDDILEMAARLKPLLAHHHNSQQLLNKLPAELIMQIGEHLLESNAFWHDKFWFREVLPLLQTSVHLRAALHPLLSTTLTCYMYVDRDTLLVEALQKVEKWKKECPHELRVELIVNVVNKMAGEGLGPSAAAAIAGDLERAIYGTLLDEQAVFVRCGRVPDGIDGVKDIHWIFISSRGREWKILAWPWDEPLCYLTQEEAELVWDSERGDDSD